MKSPLRVLALLFVVVLLASCATTAQPAGNGPSATASSHLATTSTNAPQPAHTYADMLSSALTMNAPRATHTATLLPNGQVLIAGGFREEGTSEIAISSAELYDPTTNTFRLTGALNEARSGHTATLLANGRVLVVGGWGASQRLASAELYDPTTETWSYAAALAAPRASMTATSLPDSRVVVIGGDSARGTPQLTVEVYDPRTNTFRSGGQLAIGRSAHSATLLQDGTILVAGGSAGADQILASAEIYDPTTNTFAPTGDLHAVRYKHAAVLLPSGMVLLVGGANHNDWNGKYHSTELYDPRTRRFSQAASLDNERFKLADAAVVLGNGDVLVAGGNRQIEIYRESKQRFVASATLGNDYYYTVLTVLHDGRVLITGGYDPTIQPTTNAWLYS